MSVLVKNLSKTFGTQKAVNQISFEARKGEILGFLGPNGAGKSTTMKMTTGYIPPSEGSIEVCGFSVERDPLYVKRKVGYLPEHNPLYLDMYIPEYLHFIGKIHDLKGNFLEKRIGEMVGLCGLERERTKKIGQLSKGYRQRVGLAQALLHDPEVLILDEPTSGLDPNQIVEIRNVIKQISQEKTLIFSTHIMQEVKALCDRVVIIHLGKIVADSPVKTLQENLKQTNIVLEFSKPVEMSLLEQIEGVRIEQVFSETEVLLGTDNRTDKRAEIFEFAVQKGWVLLGIRKQESSLEEIFYSLTQGF